MPSITTTKVNVLAPIVCEQPTPDGEFQVGIALAEPATRLSPDSMAVSLRVDDLRVLAQNNFVCPELVDDDSSAACSWATAYTVNQILEPRLLHLSALSGQHLADTLKALEAQITDIIHEQDRFTLRTSTLMLKLADPIGSLSHLRAYGVMHRPEEIESVLGLSDYTLTAKAYAESTRLPVSLLAMPPAAGPDLIDYSIQRNQTTHYTLLDEPFNLHWQSIADFAHQQAIATLQANTWMVRDFLLESNGVDTDEFSNENIVEYFWLLEDAGKPDFKKFLDGFYLESIDKQIEEAASSAGISYAGHLRLADIQLGSL